jgi:hypothetical protein
MKKYITIMIGLCIYIIASAQIEPINQTNINKDTSIKVENKITIRNNGNTSSVVNLANGREIDSVSNTDECLFSNGITNIETDGYNTIYYFDIHYTGNYFVKRNDKWLVVNKEVNILFNDLFDSYKFINSRNVYVIEKNGKKGILSANLELKIKPGYDEIEGVDTLTWSSNDNKKIVYLKNGDLTGIADLALQVKIPAEYYHFSKTSNSEVLLAYKNGVYSLIYLNDFSVHGNIKCDDVNEITSSHKDSEAEQYFVVRTGEHFGLLDKVFNKITDTIYNCISILPKTKYFLVGKIRDWAYTDFNIKYGLMDRNGEIIVAPVYDEITTFENGLIKVVKNMQVGVIDKNCHELIKPQYYELKSLGSKLFAFKSGELWGVVSVNGEVLKKPSYSYLLFLYESSDRSISYTAYDSNGRYGIIDQQLKVVLEPKYSNIFPFKKDDNDVSYNCPYFSVRDWKNTSAWGIIDTSLKTVLKVEYSWIYATDQEKVWKVEKEGKCFYINEKEEFVSECEN